MTYFAFCIHNHQPVGNFTGVLEESYEKSYWPFLKTLSKHPSIKLTLHTSGFLLDWIAENRKEYIELLKEMVSRAQVEIMGGGYYEPILPVIPEVDRTNQLRLMSDKVQELFGTRPRGIWLAERVWEPHLPTSLKKAGVEYLLVDDYHFIKSGLTREELGGYYITEDQGSIIKVFPGSETLRYMIPFQPLDKLHDHLMGLKGFLRCGNAAIYGDDGEKFGVWPGTSKWVYDEGWLESFFALIESMEWLKPVTLAGYLDAEESLGRVYLPTTSYMEMGEWSLPAAASKEYTGLIEEVKGWNGGERVRRFLQGGTWRNFFAKYPESNWMHKRMLLVSRALNEKRKEAGSKELDAAAALLYKAQCNDAYWHGIFGGLYLPHLRTGVYENLIRAENIISGGTQSPSITSADFDADGHEEVIIKTPELNLFLRPRSGGGLFELDFKPKAVNLLNTLSRWPEGYHHKLEAEGGEGGGNEAKSIHEVVLVKEKDLKKYLKFDRMRRGSLIDHFFGPDVTLEAFSANTHAESGNFHLSRYETEIEEGEDRTLRLLRWGDVEGTSVFVSKEITPRGANAFTVNYRIENDIVDRVEGVPPYRFGAEFNVILPCCDGPACRYDWGPSPSGAEIGLGSSGELTGIENISLVDAHMGVALTIELSEPATLWRFPLHTVSLSEAGFEKN